MGCRRNDVTLRSFRFAIALLALTVSCGAETAGPATSVPTSPSSRPDGPLPDCDLETGPAVITGVVTWLSGGIAGFNHATLEPTDCTADGPVPIANLGFTAFPIAASTSDCDDCADGLTTSTSDVVAVTGVIVESAELAGEQIAPGALVLVADGRAQAAAELRYRALDIPGITWDLRTRFAVVDDELVICEIDAPGCREGSMFAVVVAEEVEIPPVVGGVSDFVHVTATTRGGGAALIESVRRDPIGS